MSQITNLHKNIDHMHDTIAMINTYIELNTTHKSEVVELLDRLHTLSVQADQKYNELDKTAKKELENTGKFELGGYRYFFKTSVSKVFNQSKALDFLKRSEVHIDDFYKNTIKKKMDKEIIKPS